MNRVIFALVFTFCITSCSEEKSEDLTNSVNKNGAVETSVTTAHINDSTDVLITKHIVWKNNVEVKSSIYNDTIPALGMEKKEVKNSDGNIVTTDAKKDYEIYITVK